MTEQHANGLDPDAITGEPFYVAIERAMLLTNKGEYAAALDECETAVRLDPEAAEPYFAMGVIALNTRDEGQALRMLEVAHKIDPETREYADALGVIYTRVGKLADGLYYTKLAAGLEPHPLLSQRMPPKMRDFGAALASASPSMHSVEAERLFNAGYYQLAARECEAEVKLNPRNQQAYFLLGRINHVLGRYERAVGAYHAAIHLAPTDGTTAARLARSLVALGRFEDAVAAARQALRCAPADPDVFGPAMDALLRCPNFPFEAARNLAVAHGRQIPEALADDLAPPREPGTGKIRVGLLSNAFFQASAANRLRAWFIRGAGTPVTFRGYALSVAQDTVTTTFRDICEEWREVYDIDPFTLGLTLKGEALDVLVDLSVPDWDGRPGVATMDPAPVRVGTHGLPEPGLAPGITHILSDETLATADRAALLDGQQLIEVPGTLFACAPFDDVPQDLPAPSAAAGNITFGGMMDLSRLTAECAGMWADVLHRTPGSRLLLCSPAPPPNAARTRAVEMFSHFGVADRLLFPTETDASDAQAVDTDLPVAQLEAIDILLDTAPCNGGRELAQALWAGIPVITLMGSRRQAAIGASILTAARRVTWIARDREEFVRIAAELAADVPALADTRAGLQKSVADTKVFDTAGLARDIAEALRRVGTEGRKNNGKTTDG